MIILLDVQSNALCRLNKVQLSPLSEIDHLLEMHGSSSSLDVLFIDNLFWVTPTKLTDLSFNCIPSTLMIASFRYLYNCSVVLEHLFSALCSLS